MTSMDQEQMLSREKTQTVLPQKQQKGRKKEKEHPTHPYECSA